MSDIPAWAKAGAKVVCIDPTWIAPVPGDEDIPDPVYGQVYTIDAVEEDDDYVGLYLVGFDDDAFYEVSGFAPLVTKSQEQDIALFRHHLDGVDA